MNSIKRALQARGNKGEDLTRNPQIQCKQLEIQIRKMKTDHQEELRAKDKELTQVKHQHQEECGRLRRLVSQFENENHHLRIEGEAITAKHTKEINDLKAQICTAAERYNVLNDENKRLEEERENRARTSSMEGQEHVMALEQEISNLKDASNADMTRQRELQERNQTLTKDLDIMKEKIRELEDRTKSELRRKSSEVKQLSYKSKTTRRDISELVMTKKDLEDLDTDTIIIMMSNFNESKYDKAQEMLTDLDVKAEAIIISIDENDQKLEDKVIQELKDQKEACKKLKEELKATRGLLYEEAKRRNICPHQGNGRKESNDFRDMQFFNNDGKMTVFEFIEQIKSFLKFNHIPFSEGGNLIKRFIRGEPKRLVDSRYGREANPDFDILCNFMIENYGNGKLIFRDIEKLHEEAGKIIDTHQFLKLSKNKIEEEKDKVRAHMVQYERVVQLRQNKHNQPEKFEVDVFSYKACILKILPDNCVRGLIREKGEGAIMNVIKTIFKEIQDELLDITQNSMYELRKGKEAGCNEAVEEPEIAKEQIQGNPCTFQALTPIDSNSKQCSKIMKENIGLHECALCNHMNKIHGSKPINRVHGATKSAGTGKYIILTFSCPYIRDLGMERREQFLELNKFCRSCLLKGVGPDHREEECKMALKYKMNCLHPGCPKRYIICSSHKYLNEKKIITKQLELKEADINFNF